MTIMLKLHRHLGSLLGVFTPYLIQLMFSYRNLAIYIDYTENVLL